MDGVLSTTRHMPEKFISKAIPFMLLELHPGNEIYYYSKQGL